MNNIDPSIAPEPYYMLRTALALFQQTPSELSDEQLTQVQQQAMTEFKIETRVLCSQEAADVIIPESVVSNAVQQVRDRFSNEEDFLTTLEHNGLTAQTLESALLRQCKVEHVLERVAARASKISDVEVDIYYHLHREKFRRPEQRGASHILITINDQFAENTREKALEKIQEIAQTLARKPHKFADLAMKHSECPSALQGGELGTFPRGKLFPEIDAVLFQLKKDQLSDIVETEAGLHIVKCTEILYSEDIPLKKARPKIRKLMQERVQRTCQRAWLATLPKSKSENGMLSTNH